MRSIITSVSIVAVLISLGACTSTQLAPVIEKHTGEPQTPVVTATPSVPAEADTGIVVQPVVDYSSESVALAAPETAGTEVTPDTAAKAVNSAIVALLNSATAHAQAGQHDAASASLERALQVEPQNAWVWHRLARVRLTQGQPEQAASLAARSNTFAANDRRLLADNWRLIGTTREQLGDVSGARAANLRADEFVSTLN